MIYRFGTCVLDLAARELRRDNLLCPVEPQVFDLLEYLIRHRARVVARDELWNKVWKGRAVSDAAIDMRVSAARQAVGDTGGEQRFIRTLRKKGFRFVGAVVEDNGQSAIPHAKDDERNRAILTDHPTIAVIPFANLSGDPRQDILSDGITEDLITALGKVNWLYVATRTSCFALKGQSLGIGQIVRKLGVRYLVDGSIRRMDGRVRLTVQLIDGFGEHQIWAERYDIEGPVSLRLYDRICEKILAAVEPHLYLAEHMRSRHKSIGSLGAWECVVRALSLMNTRDRRKVATAHALLRKAVSIDPASAQNHSLLSIITTLRVHMSWAERRDVVPAALNEARTALALNPDEPWAHAALGYASIWKQPEDSILPCRRAIALDSNFAVGHYFLALGSTYAGHHADVLAHADMAERLAPRDLLARGYAGAHDNVRATASFATEDYRRGIRFASNATVYSPNSPTAHRALIINLALAGKSPEAQHALQTLQRLAPDISQDWLKQNAVWSSGETMRRYVDAFRASGLE
ncbi:MAG TPA: winged helix-turn-helix domain-containing protein [Xanthobacteraceae bacterium]|nr:winged helix-turn-helix domain-containing protein [Xanthobacteraceae bacterium]